MGLLELPCPYALSTVTKSRPCQLAQPVLLVLLEEHVRLAVERHAQRPVSRATAYTLMARIGRQRFQDYEAWHCLPP